MQTTDDGKALKERLTPRLHALAARAASSPSDGASALELTRALIAAHEFSLAIDAARQGVDRVAGQGDGGTIGSLWYELLFAVARKDVRELGSQVRAVQKLLRQFPDAAWSHRNMALVYYYTEDDARCRKELKRALELDASDQLSHEVRALLAQADGDADELRVHLRESLKMNESPRLRKMLADACVEAGESEEGERHYLKAIEGEPLSVEAWHGLGELYLEHNGDYLAGFRCFSHALSINPRFWDVYFSLTDHYVEEKRYELARAEVLRVLLFDPDASIKAEVENHLGYMDYVQGNYEDAVKRYRRAITLDPEFDSPWHNLGLVHVHEKDWDSAIECFQKAIDLNEDRSWSYTQAGLAYFERRNYRKARALFQEALRRNAEEYGAHLGLAELFRREKRHDAQLEECLKAFQIEPNDGNVRNYLGIAYECNRRYDEAVKEYQEALRLDPVNRWAANNLGYLYEKLRASTGDKSYRELAIHAWKVRLYICRDTQTSTAGARRHLLKLGVPEATFERWLREGKLEVELQKMA